MAKFCDTVSLYHRRNNFVSRRKGTQFVSKFGYIAQKNVSKFGYIRQKIVSDFGFVANEDWLTWMVRREKQPGHGGQANW